MLSFIPYVGTITGGVDQHRPGARAVPNWTGVAVVAAVFMLGQMLEGYVIYPRFLGDRVELHAVWVIFALFAGGAAFGFLGVLLAVPVAAAIGVLARFWLRRYLQSPLYLEPPPAASDVSRAASWRSTFRTAPQFIAADFLPSASNAARAGHSSAEPRDWPQAGWRCGARAARGKTHLLHIWAPRRRARRCSTRRLALRRDPTGRAGAARRSTTPTRRRRTDRCCIC